jgi:hypothetical protein
MLSVVAPNKDPEAGLPSKSSSLAVALVATKFITIIGTKVLLKSLARVVVHYLINNARKM